MAQITTVRTSLFLGALVSCATALAEPPTSPVQTAPTARPAPLQSPTSPQSLQAGPYCSGEYADDFAALAPKAREYEQQQAAYTFCIRTTATYECPSYGSDGNLRRTRKNVVAHGSGFAFRQQSGETLLLTNQHVAEWPTVTDEDHPVDDVPLGCKRVADSLKIVDGEADAYERDDISLSRILSDPQLDVSVLKARALLPVLPWKIGRSAGLRERNVVDVRGFPLGVFKATNVGKVVSAYDHDDDKDWDHDDFVIDALLSPGNSGSPVLAISCKTGELELVGVFHAGYTHSSALNVVVGIDQIRDLMTTLKRTPRAHADSPATLDSQARARLFHLASTSIEPFFSFGPVVSAVRARGDGALLFELLSRDFPFKVCPVAVIEDLPPQPSEPFGVMGRIWLGTRQGLKAYSRSDLDSESQGLAVRLLDTLRRDSLAMLDFRAANRAAGSSRDHFERMARVERSLRRTAASRQDLSQAALDLADRMAPQGSDTASTLADALVAPPIPTGPSSSAPIAGLAAGPRGSGNPPVEGPKAVDLVAAHPPGLPLKPNLKP